MQVNTTSFSHVLDSKPRGFFLGFQLKFDQAGFSPDTLLMELHRAPAMTRESICFGVHVDGVCAVGCDRTKVLSAMAAVTATLGRRWLAVF